MLSGFSRFLFALAAIAPVTVVWAIVDFERNGASRHQAAVLSFGLLIAALCWLLLYLSEHHLTRTTFTASEVKAVDSEVVAYVVAYLFPLLAPSSEVGLLSQAAILLVLVIVLATSNAFTFNPLITFLGYRFYEVKSSAGVTYLFVSKLDITDVKQIHKVGKVSQHLMLHLE